MDGLIGVIFAVLLAYFFFKGGTISGSVTAAPPHLNPVAPIRPITQTPAGWQVPGGTDTQICPSWGCVSNPIEVGGIFSTTPGTGSGTSSPTGSGGGSSGGSGSGSFSGGGGGGTGGGSPRTFSTL